MSTPTPSEPAMRAAKSAFGADYHLTLLVELAKHIDTHAIAIAPAVAELVKENAELRAYVAAMESQINDLGIMRARQKVGRCPK